MNCREVRRWISPYLDSELDPKTTFQVSQHLEGCADCRRRFDQERQADRLIATAMSRFEPAADWTAIERALRAPRRVRLWRSAGILAAAACVALVVLGLGWPRELQANPAQWAVHELNRLRPNCEPFDQAGACQIDRLRRMSQEVLQADFPLELSPGGDGVHQIQLVGFRERPDARGRKRLEVYLNCCGKPVLLVAARENCLGQLDGVCSRLSTCPSGCWKDTARCKGAKGPYEVAACRRGDVVLVAVSPAPHSPDHIFRNR